MPGRISILRQCLKAMQDVPHDIGCNAEMIREDFPCHCTRNRERFAKGLEAALRYVDQRNYYNMSREERMAGALRAFVKAASVMDPLTKHQRALVKARTEAPY
jgi:hypothetical protein